MTRHNDDKDVEYKSLYLFRRQSRENLQRVICALRSLRPNSPNPPSFVAPFISLSLSLSLSLFSSFRRVNVGAEYGSTRLPFIAIEREVHGLRSLPSANRAHADAANNQPDAKRVNAL